MSLRPVGFAGKPRTWSVVLAGGEGTRMQSMVQLWLGEPRPKQYCTFFGDQPMLDFAMQRARRLSGDQRVMTVTGPGHSRHLEAIGYHPVGQVIEQPDSLGTAVGLLLPVALIRARDPEAIVTALPSDHFIYPESRLDEHLASAVAAADADREALVLLGAVPTHAEPEYGWMEATGEAMDHCVRPVRAFKEKPRLMWARRYFEQGWLWNTMIMAASVQALWAIAEARFPQLTLHLGRFAEEVHGKHTLALPRGFSGRLRETYKHLEACDFSNDALEREHHRIRVLAMEGVTWNDWGRPHRIAESLVEAGLEPAFPADVFASASPA